MNRDNGCSAIYKHLHLMGANTRENGQFTDAVREVLNSDDHHFWVTCSSLYSDPQEDIAIVSDDELLQLESTIQRLRDRSADS